MTKYKAYPEYKDSGVEWLGEIPKDWDVLRLKFVASMHANKTIDNNTRYVGMENIASKNGKYIIKDDIIPEGVSTIFKKDDVLFGKLRPYLAKSWLASFSGVCSSEFLVLRSSKIHPRFMNYYTLTDEFISQVNSSTYGSKMPRANWEFISLLSVPMFSYNLSEKIANFLDSETAKIDKMIEKQQKLIELLKEKRQAVISHAVTKGLNPDVPMKDSGVEWLGEVPAHWVIAQLKFNMLEMQTGPFGSQLHAQDYIIDGVPLINPAHMISGDLIPDAKITVDLNTQKRLERHKLSEGELIFSRRGELGRCAVVRSENVGWLCGTGSLKAKLSRKILPEYAYILMSSEGVVSEFNLESKGSTMANLNTETLGRVRIPVPPAYEQESILKHVGYVSDKYDLLIKNADIAINLMQERRTALISAAVTGKIDVRNWVAPAASEAASDTASQEVNA